VKKGCWSRQIKTYTALFYSIAFTNTVFVNFIGHLVVAEIQVFLWVVAEDMCKLMHTNISILNVFKISTMY